jgi:hypothetical protein
MSSDNANGPSSPSLKLRYYCLDNDGYPVAFAGSDGPSQVGPVVLRSDYRDNLEISKIVPAGRPRPQGANVLSFHDLETAHLRRVDPARNVYDSLWQHPSFTRKSLADWSRVVILKVFDHHEQHCANISHATFRRPTLLPEENGGDFIGLDFDR